MSLHPLDVPNLLCFWDFQQAAGSDRVARGPHRYRLTEQYGEVERVDDGIFGPGAARIRRGQWFRAARGECPALNLYGRQEVSVVAWIQRETPNDQQFIAGLWNERAKRQYALFTSGKRGTHCQTWKRSPAKHQVHGYVSAEGGFTPGHEDCYSCATGGSYVTPNTWHTIAFSYDHLRLCVYSDGAMDHYPDHNPFQYDRPIFDGGGDGADFTVAQRGQPGWDDYPNRTGVRDEGFGGVIGGLAVYDRALTEHEMRRLYRPAH